MRVSRGGESLEFSVVIPAYLEERRIGTSLDLLAIHLVEARIDGAEVLVVATEGSDATADVARQRDGAFARLRVMEVPLRGKGSNVRQGMLAATGRYRMFMDADLATPLHHLDRALAQLRSGADVVIGIRDLRRSHRGMRRVISLGGNALTRALVLPGIPDTQCGFKAFSAAAASSVFGRQTIPTWAFDIEILAIARSLGYRIDALLIPDWADVPGGPFDRSAAVRAAFSTLGQVVRIAARSRRGQGQVLAPEEAVADPLASLP